MPHSCVSLFFSINLRFRRLFHQPQHQSDAADVISGISASADVSRQCEDQQWEFFCIDSHFFGDRGRRRMVDVEGHVVDCCAGFLESRVFQVGFRAEHGCMAASFAFHFSAISISSFRTMLGRLLSGSEEGQKDRAVLGEIVQGMRLSIQILQRDLRQFDVL